MQPKGNRTIYLDITPFGETGNLSLTVYLIVESSEEYIEIPINIHFIEESIKDTEDNSVFKNNKLIIIIIIAIVVLIIVSILLFIFWIFMVYDCIHRDFKSKYMWLVIINIIPLSYIVYYFKIKRKYGALKKTSLANLPLISYLLGTAAVKIPIYFGVFTGIPAIIIGLVSRKESKDIELSKAAIFLGIWGIATTVFLVLAYFIFLFFIFSMGVIEG